MSYTIATSPFLSPLSGDPELGPLFSVEADVSAMLQFEVNLAAAQAELGIIPSDAATVIHNGCSTFRLDEAELLLSIARDGMSVPGLISQLRQHIGAKFGPYLHVGSTSQDVIDTSLMIRSSQGFDLLKNRLRQLTFELTGIAEQYGQNFLIARTRMQRALPVRVENRIGNWQSGVSGALGSVEGCRFLLQCGGPVGTLADFGEKAELLKRNLAARLGLALQHENWHVDRSPILNIANAASHVTTSLGKIGQDYALMAQNEIAEVKISGTGSSSAMHHKSNPVKAEVLVSLARFNATLVSGMHHACLHEQERSGSAWTLEWLMLPQMVLAAGASTRLALELVTSTIAMGGK